MAGSIRPVLFIVIGMFAIAVNDVLFKLFSGDYSLYQLVATRSGLALCILLPAFMRTTAFKTIITTRRPWLTALRCCLLVMANSLFFAGLASLPLAESSALVFLAPLVTMTLAHFVLGETVGPVRWAMAALAFAGMICVVQPFSASFERAYLLPLAAAFAYGTFNSVTRALARTEGTATLAFYPMLAFFVSSVILGLIFASSGDQSGLHPSLAFLTRPWQWPSLQDWVFMGLIGLGASVIASSLAAAYRMGEASFLAPFEYVYLVFGLIFGYAVWRDFPNDLALLGMAMILTAGIVMAWREVQKGRRLARGYYGSEEP